MFDPAQFQRKADFRGIYPNQINEELAWLAGRYLVRFLQSRLKIKSPAVVVGRDGRLSSPQLYAAHLQGIAAEGGMPIPCGLATTDMVQWATGKQLDGAVAGSMISASHNPKEYNGIKMVLRDPETASLEMIRPVEHLAEYFRTDIGTAIAPAAPCAPFPATAGLNLHRLFTAAACERAPRLKEARGRIVLDPGNGVGGMLVPLVRQALTDVGAAAELFAVAEWIDGTFPTRPSNPGLPGAVKVLQAKVREVGAILGAAFDGDADRVFLVDEHGEFVAGSTLLAALAQQAVRQNRPKIVSPAIVYAAVASWLVVDSVQKAGGTPVLCKVGQDSIKVALMKTEAVFGGESSAHYDFPDAYCLDSGLFALMTFWQMLLESGQTCSQLLGSLNPWPASGEINLLVNSSDWRGTSAAVISALDQRFQAPAENCYVLTLDGIAAYYPKVSRYPTVDDLFAIDRQHDPQGKTWRLVQPGYAPQWWMNVRASNNEPLLRLNVEARDPAEVSSRTESLLGIIRDCCREHNATFTIEK